MTTLQNSSAISSLRELFIWLPQRRQRQFVCLVLASFVGAVAEFTVLGSLVPFLTVLASPAAAEKFTGGGAMGQVHKLLATFSGTQSPLVPLGAALILLVLVSTALRLALTWATTRFAQILGHDLATRLYRVTLDQPYAFHVSTNTSGILSSVHKAEQLVYTLITPFLELIVASVLALGVIAALMWVNWLVAITAAASFGAIYVTVSKISRNRVVHNSRLRAAAQTHRICALNEGLGGIRDTILDSSQSIHARRFAKHDIEFRLPFVENSLWGQLPKFVVEGFGVAVIVVLTIIVTGTSGNVAASLPILGAVALGAQRLLPLFQRIYAAWNTVTGSRGSAEDVFCLLRLEDKGTASVNKSTPPVSYRKELRLDNVGFRYSPTGPWVFRDLDLTIPKGARLGFAGATGCGKSTLLDVIMGLLEPVEGRITVDGVAVDRSNIQSWRRHIAHVPQAIFLTDASIAENIAYAVPVDEIDFQRVEEAARRARVHEFVERLPQGYQTTVGERGVRLSGGQRQRIGIARALYRKADVLVLDEATSALDTQTEASVMAGVEALGNDITVLIVAHRLATLENCDHVIDLAAMAAPVG